MEKVVASIFRKFLVVYLFVMLDYLLTVMILNTTGEAFEANPWLRFLMKTFHTTGAIGYAKVAGLTLLCATLIVAINSKNLTMLKRIDRMLGALVFVTYVIVCYVGYVWTRLL